MWTLFYKLASPQSFYRITGRWLPWLWLGCGLLFCYGLIDGLLFAPADYQQGNAYRIMFVHVPSAILSLSIYLAMAGASAVYLIWRIKLADVIAKVSAPLGAWFTFLALVTGALWGKPMWGTYWIWDARLTSELILLFLFLAVIALRSAIDEPRKAAQACGLLALVGVVDLPIIHFSVYWWNTLHQKDTLALFGQSTIAPSMEMPLLAMLGAFFLYYLAVLLMRARCEVLQREQQTAWVQKVSVS